jgi:hypothetical protein
LVAGVVAKQSPITTKPRKTAGRSCLTASTGNKGGQIPEGETGGIAKEALSQLSYTPVWLITDGDARGVPSRIRLYKMSDRTRYRHQEAGIAMFLY